MSAQINFFSGSNFINDLSGSGCGFFGDLGWGAAVPVSFWQGRSFITDSAGVNQGPEMSNVKYLNSASGVLGQTGSGIGMRAIPNAQATLNIRFTNDTAVKVQNSYIQVYDRVAVANPPSGITFACAGIIHPDPAQSNNGSGDPVWRFPAGTSIMSLGATFSPGMSGLSPNGSNTSADRHDFFIAMSASPNSVGSKNWALLASVEYY